MPFDSWGTLEDRDKIAAAMQSFFFFIIFGRFFTAPTSESEDELSIRLQLFYGWLG